MRYYGFDRPTRNIPPEEQNHSTRDRREAWRRLFDRQPLAKSPRQAEQNPVLSDPEINRRRGKPWQKKKIAPPLASPLSQTWLSCTFAFRVKLKKKAFRWRPKKSSGMNIPKRKISKSLRAGGSQSPHGVAKERPLTYSLSTQSGTTKSNTLSST